MPKTSSPSLRPLRGALAGLALVALAPAAGATPRALAPRAAVVKHTGHELAAGTPVERLVVKFHEGSRVRLRDNALVALISERSSSERSLFFGRGMSEARLTEDLRSVEALLDRAPRTRRPQRLLQEDEATLEARKASGEALSGEQLADLNLYFQVPLLPGTTSERATVNTGLDAALRGVLAAVDLPPTTPLYTANQGYLNVAPGGIDATYAWTVAGGTGTGVRIVDVETGWNRSHEDMPALFYVGAAGTVSDHGTAVLGELVAVNNAYGMKGIAYGAQMGVESHTPQGLSSALSKAVTAAGPGGIVLVEVHSLGPNDGTACTCNTSQCHYIAVEYWQAAYDIIRNATANGVIVVEAAGNGSANLDAAAYAGRFNRA
ncbi:MAG: peptidase S8, partial [Myxococcaceae bacterium]